MNDDAVKVLDFGLAKAVEGVATPAERVHVSGLLRRMEDLLEGDTASTDIASSPALSEIVTRPGILLGTVAYMSPEQAKGGPADRRADIWAFGCVLYEMLTGKMAFRGESTTDTLAAVIRAEPDWSQLPATIPPHVGAPATLPAKGCASTIAGDRRRTHFNPRSSFWRPGADGCGLTSASGEAMAAMACLGNSGLLCFGDDIAGRLSTFVKSLPHARSHAWKYLCQRESRSGISHFHKMAASWRSSA